MALDEALMDSVREGEPPVLRFYRWQPACLSLGRNQPAAGFYDRKAIARLGLDVVRRPTGGRAVLHARELTYSVVVPERALGSLRHSYLLINRSLAAGLQELGVAAVLQGPTGDPAPAPSVTPCFRDPLEGEVIVTGHKLVGSAQYRHRGVLLQHGSLLIEDDQKLLSELETERGSGWASPPAVLADHCDPLPSWDRLTAALANGWRNVTGGTLYPSAPTRRELHCAGRHLRRHSDLEWIWRR